MAQTSFGLLATILLLLLVVLAEGGPPKPLKVKCQDKKFASCYHKDLFCPVNCPRTCIADCDSCQPICVPQLPPPKPRSPKKVKCQDKNFPKCYHKDLFCPVNCPRTCIVDCDSCQPICVPPPLPPPKPRSPMKVKCQDKKFPKCYRKTFACPANCPRSCIADCDSCQPVCLPLSPPLPTPPTPPSTPNSPPPPDQAAGGKSVSCKNKLYPQCYRQEHQCPSACPNTCEVDCVTCSPICDCNRPGAVCQDPRFVGADGLTFYFHGKKDDNFCLVTDSNLHINAHFIGRRNENMKRDFTWVQSLGILYNNHKLFISAKKTSTWNDALDRLDLAFDGQSITLPNREGVKYLEPDSNTTITRNRDTNSVVIEVEGNFQIKARVVPITEKESRIHKYGITEDDCFAHLDLGFKFYSLSEKVNGVLGQTYGSNYVSRVKMGIEMPVLGGDKEFASSSIFSTDCAVSRFSTTNNQEYDDFKCSSGMDGKGVVC
ncbi:uncharacterized protein LOC107027365 [Solanum pennellii]|uniref:Uncharacterized protein LOC107027365 n=1 Tax=Solanum pennellii TaxID=28526 RepID=A0ABM1HDT3_SOLPN|nr:uncharacterized protein LOC107027365 [Solanum pennellii]